MIQARKIVLGSSFEAAPKISDFRLEFEDIYPLQDGEILVKAVYLSVDPYMRVILPKMPLNSTVIGEQIGVIIESKNENFPVNAFIWSFFGWRDLTVYRPTTGEAIAGCILPYILPAMDNMPLSSRLSVFGMTGNSAYFGLLEICQPKKGETVVVTGAAGAVGSIVGQIAKIRGCKVIGIAGSDLKCEWLTRELKFDHAINYKSENVIENLRKRAPDGVDCFFDNVGGETSSSVISHMNDHGRIAVCGSISAYNAEDSQKASVIQPFVSTKQLRMEGFVVTRWFDRWNEGIQQLRKWIDSGELIYRETITEDFENLPKAFIGLFNGENIGKALVKA